MLIVCLAATFMPTAAVAKEDAARFLQELQNRDCGEEGIAYLEQLKREGKLPPELVDVFDLEMSLCYFLAHNDSAQPVERNQRVAKAQEHVKKFFDEHPHHPRRADALALAGDLKNDRAQVELRKARRETDDAKRADVLVEARKRLVEARSSYVEAAEALGEQFSAAKHVLENRQASRNAKAKATRLRLVWLQTRLKVAMVDYHMATTYPAPKQKPGDGDPVDKLRADAFRKAAKEFDEIHQENRTMVVGVDALLWQGKCLDESGDYTNADEIYQEVLAYGPDEPGEKPTGFEPLVAKAMAFHLHLVRRRDGVKEFIKEAEKWLNQFAPLVPGARNRDNLLRQTFRDTDGFRDVCLDLAKAYVDESKRLRGDERTDLMKRVFRFQQILNASGDEARDARELLKTIR